MAGKSLGTLTLDLVAKTGMFEAGLDRAGRKLSETERKAAAFGKVLGNSILAGAGIAAAGLAIYVKNTIEAEKVQAQLAARIKDTGGAAGRSVQQLGAMADKLQGLTVFDDEAIGGAQALLLTFTQIQGVNFDRATEAVTDLATVMGTDLDSAAKIVGKSLADPVSGLNALKKAGVIFNAEQKELIKNLVEVGRVSDAQTVILDALKGKMGSAAEAARNTLGGALQGLQNDFDNLLEGDSGSEGVKGATRAINELGETLRSPGVKAGVESMVNGLVEIAKFSAQAIDLLGGVARAASQAFTANSSKSYEGLLQRRLDITDRMERLKKGKNGTGSALDNAVTAASWVGLGPDIKTLEAELAQVDALLNKSRALQQKANAPAGEPSSMSIDINRPLSVTPTGATGSKAGGRSTKDNSAAEALRSQEEAARDYQSALESINGVLDEQARLTGGELTEAAFKYKDAMVQIQQSEDELTRLGKLDAETSAAIAQARDQATEAYNKQVEAINNQKNPAQEMLADLEEELKLLGMTNVEREKAIALRHANADAASVEGIAISQAIDNLDQSRRIAEGMDVLRNATHNLFADIASGAKSAKDIFKDFLQSIIDGITNLIAQQLTQGLFGSMGSSGGGLFGGFFNSLFGGLFGNSSGGGMPSLGDFFGSANGNVFSGGKAMAFANGGVIGGPTMFPMSDGRTGLMGEAGPEAIMPLRRGPDGKLGVHVQGGGNSGRPITIINNIPPTTERRSGQQIAQRTSEKLRIATSRNS